MFQPFGFHASVEWEGKLCHAGEEVHEHIPFHRLLAMHVLAHEIARTEKDRLGGR
jgi:hypothetical protein